MGILDRFDLTGKVVVVTGASSGLGAAFARALAEAGADVALGARRLERLEGTRRRIEALGRESLAVTTDVTKPEDCRSLAEATEARFGRVDALVNCAGLGAFVPASRELPEEFRLVVETNLMGSYWMAQACASFMKPGGSIVNVSSISAFTSVGLPMAAYSSSKAAVVALTRDLAHQWGRRRGIRVNAVAPGWFPTEMTDDLKPEYLQKIIQDRVPMARLGELDECAAAVVFLASDASSYVTGVCIPVDGGLLTN